MFPTFLRLLSVCCLAGGVLATVPGTTATAEKQPNVQSTDTPAPPPRPADVLGAPAPVVESVETAAAEPWPKLLARLFLHVLATVFGLRAGMKIFYENSMLAGFVGVVLIDAMVILGMALLGPATAGLAGMLGPQAIVSAAVMMATLHHFGFTKDRFTVIMATVVAKGFGCLAELGLRLLFLDAVLRSMADLGW